MKSINISGWEQFLHENQTWRRALDFYLQENSYMKTRLSQVVDNNTDKEFVDLAEHFNTAFIHNDECIKDLRNDVIDMERQLKSVITGQPVEKDKIKLKQSKLRNEMGHFEKVFELQRDKFNQYLVSLL